MRGCWGDEHDAECLGRQARGEPTAHWICIMPWHTLEDIVLALGGGMFGGSWYCSGCGNPQLGDPPWAEVLVRDRCRPCGPGKGWVLCPATHHPKATCGLCRGRGWVEEI